MTFQLRANAAEILGLSDISPEDLQHEILGPHVNKLYTKLAIAKRQTDGYYTLYVAYTRSQFRDFESYLRFLVGLDEDNFQCF